MKPVPLGPMGNRRLEAGLPLAVMAAHHLACVWALFLQGPQPEPVPPGQPEAGPGGAEYAHASVVKSRLGEGGREVWLFEPAEPRPEAAPVIVFLHGLSATNPRTYGAWIDHLVRQGRIVVYPRFQAGLVPRPRSFTPNAVAAVRSAIDTLSAGDHVRPDLDRIAIIGHSIGGILAANLTALAEEEGLPIPRAVFCVQPGSTDPSRIDHIELADLSRIKSGTLILTLAGDADSIAGDRDAQRIYRESTEVVADDKDFVLMRSDSRGAPALRANHLSPLATDQRYHEDAEYDALEALREADALDFYGTWKLLDALCDAAFDGENRGYALGNTPEQRFMGTWSDGRAVSELVVRDLVPDDPESGSD